MSINELKIKHSKKYLWLYIVVLILLVTFMTMAEFLAHYYIFLGFGILFSIPIIYMIIDALLFQVQISGSHFNVRTWYGREYEFNCSDIEMVDFIRMRSRYGPYFFIDIKTSSEKLQIRNHVIGFDDMIEYILTKYQTGSIKPQAMSQKTQDFLLKYKNGEVFKGVGMFRS